MNYFTMISNFLYTYDSLKLKTEFKNYSCMCAYYLERGEI